MIPGGTGFNPEDPSHWANLFALALNKFGTGAGLPEVPGRTLPNTSVNPFGPAPDSAGSNPFGSAPNAPSSPYTFPAPTAAAPRPAQGQGLGNEGQYGGDEYAHAGWGTAQPFDYSTYHPQRHPQASPQYPQGPSPWESYWTWLGKYANPQAPGYHVGGRY